MGLVIFMETKWFSLIFFFFFLALQGPSAPRNLSAQSVNSKEILVSWVAPVNPNGRIKYRLSFNNRTQPSKLVYDGNDTQHVVSNLKPYTQYNFSVVAYNVKYNLSSATVDTLETTAQAG